LQRNLLKNITLKILLKLEKKNKPKNLNLAEKHFKNETQSFTAKETKNKPAASNKPVLG
jgi:hypothetical protein